MISGIQERSLRGGTANLTAPKETEKKRKHNGEFSRLEIVVSSQILCIE